MKRILLFQYLKWYFNDVPREIYQAWNNYLYFTFNYFSIGLLIKTYFFPWHRYYFSFGKRWDLLKYMESLAGNIMSITIGIILRTFLIIFGVLALVFVFFVGILGFVFWFCLPLIIVFIFLIGLVLILA